MVSQDTLLNLKSNLDSEITRFDTLYSQYTSYSRSMDEMTKMKHNLEDEIGKIHAEKKDSEQKAEALNRAFLDSRPDLGVPFQPRRIKTLQDFTLFFFSLSYLLLILAVSMAIYRQTSSIKYLLSTFFGSLIVGFIVFVVIYRYA
jgi:hypothetical protein